MDQEKIAIIVCLQLAEIEDIAAAQIHTTMPCFHCAEIVGTTQASIEAYHKLRGNRRAVCLSCLVANFAIYRDIVVGAMTEAQRREWDRMQQASSGHHG